MSLEAVREYLALLWKRYQVLSSREERSIVLDEICRNLKIHRKSAIRLMKAAQVPKKKRGPTQAPKRRYSEECREHVKKLWRQMGYIASIRVKAAFPDWIPHYQDCTDLVKEELIRISASSIERILKPERAVLQRRFNTGTRINKKIVTQIPIRNLSFTPKEGGFLESDTVCHCGDSMSGSFIRSLTAVDLCFGWTEVEALEKTNGQSVKEGLKEIESRMPFDLKGFFADGGSEFWNHDVVDGYIKKFEELEYGRGRSYRSNDQAHIEQKNDTHVRRVFGYDRISGKVAANMMNNIYRKEWRLLQNFFLPQSRLVEKKRIGSKVIRRMDVPKTPYQRILEANNVDPDIKTELLKQRETLNPFELRAKLTKKLKVFARYLKDEWTNPFYGKYHDKP